MFRIKSQTLFFVLAMILLSFGSSGCDFFYKMVHKEGAEEREIMGVLDPTERNPQVARVQGLLKLYGYPIGKPDGVLGTNTRLAIGQFQADNGLEVNRFVDRKTWEAIIAYEDNELIQDGKLHMKMVQQALQNAGFDPGAIDGYGGRRTVAAIKAFQQEKGLQPDGHIGLKTIKELTPYLHTQE